MGAVGNEAAVHNNVGTALRKKGDLPGAVSAYGEAIAADPKQPLLRYNLARAWEDLARTDDALREYQAAVELDPALHAAHVRLTKLLLKSRPADSLRAARTAVALRPQVSVASLFPALLELSMQFAIRPSRGWIQRLSGSARRRRAWSLCS